MPTANSSRQSRNLFSSGSAGLGLSKPMRRRLLPALLLIVFFGVPYAAGTEASYRLRGGDTPINHSVNGFSQVVEVLGDGEVLVRVGVPPVAVGGETGPFEADPGVEDAIPDGFDLPARLRSNLSPDLDAYTRATRVLKWVDSALSLDTSSGGDQDAVSVLRRGDGRCSGLANATVAMLRAAGFEARTISGLLVSDDRVVPHRWLECRLPGAGWVPTDPTMGFWVVTPRHLAFRDTVTHVPTVEVVAQPGDFPRYPRVDGVPIRPGQGSELACRVVNPCEGLVVGILRGESGVELRTTIEGLGHFSGLMPGRWRLEVRLDSGVVARQTFEIEGGRHYSIAVRIKDEQCLD